MPNVKDLKEELSELTTMKFISGAFTEAAAFKLKDIRASFEKNREFYDDLSHIYHLVRVNATSSKLDKAKKETKSLKPPHVALTSNKHFYGTLNAAIMTAFVKDVENLDTDILIIGTTGLEFLRGVRFSKPHQDLIFQGDNPSVKEGEIFLKIIQKYDKVIIYYPKYVTLLSQGVGIVDITHTQVLGGKETEDELHIIFEPELAKIIDFFENQVRLMLFRRVLFETDIARTSARMISMSAAEERAEGLIKEKKSQYAKAMSNLANLKLLDTFTGLSKWGKKQTGGMGE